MGYRTALIAALSDYCHIDHLNSSVHLAADARQTAIALIKIAGPKLLAPKK